MAYEYAPTYKSGSATGEQAQQTGLGTAKNILKDTLRDKQTYPGDISDQLTGPAQMGTSANVGYDLMGKVQGMDPGGSEALRRSTGVFEGIGQNGYQDLQNALMDPIYNQAQTAQQQIGDIYGGRGMYGSVGNDLMSGASAQSQQATQDALSNAVASRYGLQLQDQEQQMAQAQNIYDSILAGQNLELDQNKALFAAQAGSADQQNAYNTLMNQTNYTNQQNQNDFLNSVLANKQQYGIDQQNWQTGIDEVNFQRALQLAGQGNSGAAVQANTDASQAAADAQQYAALAGGIGSLGGSLMGNYDSSGSSGWNFSDLKFW